jgi:hypothetical protein
MVDSILLILGFRNETLKTQVVELIDSRHPFRSLNYENEDGIATIKIVLPFRWQRKGYLRHVENFISIEGIT